MKISASGNPLNVSLGPGTLTRSYEYDTYENLSSILSGEWRQSFNFNGASGNLTGRSYMNSDSTFMKSESFLYDTRNRLTTTQVTGQSQKSVTYDQTGNILTKTDAGTYYYNTNNVNALASVNFLHSGITTEPQTITYNSQNKVTEMSEGDYSYNVLYGANGERIKSRLYENSILSKTIYYSPGYEKITTTGGTVENHYVVSPFGLEAIITKTGATETLYLAETDHLGSMIGLFDTSGVHVERYSYDAWGRRRNPSDWTFNNVPAPVITERGFTGHEHLDNFRLINMNGRMYDPIVARFLNVDPIIQNIFNSQNFNGYNYCINNPLKYIDPSGYTANPYYMWQLARRKGYPGTYVDFLDQYYEQYSEGGGSMVVRWDKTTGEIKSVNSIDTVPDSTPLPEYVVVNQSFQITLSFNIDPIVYYFDTYDRSQPSNDILGGVSGANAMISIAGALESLSPVKKATNLVGVGLTLISVRGVVIDKSSKEISYEDLARLSIGAISIGSDYVVPGLGGLASILDYYGYFEPFYHSAEVLDETGYFVYLNPWTWRMKYKKGWL